jgi:hypothetical protein
MSNIEDRPYVGTWRLNNRAVIKYTPDALLFINGDTSLPGCPRCRGRIEIQNFVTSFNVEAGTETGSHSATVNLTLPRVQGQQVFIDGYNILRPGLEVNIFARGYFPIRGMFRHLPDPQESGLAIPSGYGERLDMSKYATYPYYPIFHGVVTQVSYEYSDGFYNGTLSCASLLHFWSYQNIVTSGAWQAQNRKPTNDTGRPTLFGHNFNNTNPFSIIYTLYKDVAGAAAGVEFALDEQSNLAANTPGGQQLYDHITTYWEQRFKTRIQSLRMYGVNGQLFNAAQQAWFGSASNRDLNKLLSSTIFSEGESLRSESDPFSARLSAAKALGLSGSGVDFIYSPLLQQNGQTVNLSILEMYAFNQAIGDIGTVNHWESTYQTKMDVAQQVCEATGYEFYQDVDGDLVFKPPFWNLDTSSNRYYRLEDQDIINITFTEKEATATYIIVRGTWTQGLTGVVSNTGVTGKRALYVDYRLVAQFGWRPAAAMDITYASDPRVLFWIGCARLDVLNVDTYSASCTIPIRPELRPGYPVYIPFCDSYYYVSQVSHQFAFGGQCTTSLVLTCRRAKFHAPGFLEAAPDGQSAIGLVRLDRPDLPPRPLEVYDNGLPRIVGFPNVVLALDPRKFNPNFSTVGVGIDYFTLRTSKDAQTSADLLISMLQQDISNLNRFEADGVVTDEDGRRRVQDPTAITKFKLRYGKNLAEVVEFDAIRLRKAFSDFKAVHDSVARSENKLARRQDQVRASQQQSNAFDQANGRGVSRNAANSSFSTDRLANIEADIIAAKRKEAEFFESTDNGRLLALIFEALQPDSNNPIRRKINGIPGSDLTLAWFESLAHLKDQFVASSIPGYYRYFSCAHPNPIMQGMASIKWDDGQRQPRRKPTPPQTKPPTPAPQKASNRKANKARALAIFNGLEKQLDLPGLARVLRVWAQNESGFNPTAQNCTAEAQFTVRTVRARVTGQPGGRYKSKKAALAAHEKFQRTWAANPYVSDEEAWLPNGCGASGWFGFLSTTAMTAFSHPDSAYHNIDPRQALFDPGTTTACALENMASATNSSIWRSLPPDQQTYMNARLLVGWGASNFRGAIQNDDIKPVTVEDVNNLLDGCTLKTEAWPTIMKNGKVVPDGGSYVARRARYYQKLCQQKLSPSEIAEFCQLQMPAQRMRKLIPNGRADAIADLARSLDPGGGEEPMPVAVPTQMQAVGEEQADPPSIVLEEADLPAGRQVIQFMPTVTTLEGLRPPEAELGVGTCSKGLRIASGPKKAPAVLSTDQIQTISFVRHEKGKFTSVVGVSQTSGRLAFNQEDLTLQLALNFSEPAQNVDDPGQLVSDVFLQVYNQLGEDLASVEIPVYQNGDQVGTTQIELRAFDDAIIFSASTLPASLQEQISAELGTSDTYMMSVLTLGQAAQFPGLKPQGPQKDDGRSLQRTIDGLAGLYAAVVSQDIQKAFYQIQSPALDPSTGKVERLTNIQDAFNSAISKAVGIDKVVNAIITNTVEEKSVKDGKITKTAYSPAFPVSDDKGYHHYGSFRYGRGLTVDPGGTFEFLHSGQDPFKNVTAQNAEEFLRVLTLQYAGKLKSNNVQLAGAREAAVEMAQEDLRRKQQPLENAQSDESDLVLFEDPTDDQLRPYVTAFRDVGVVAKHLDRDTLRAFLMASGDDPNLIEAGSFNIVDTQFARNFANFAVNYGNNSVFKTTISNAAYRLADLTSHLVARAGEACVCRGSHADVVLAAYARSDFVTVGGVDPREQPAVAFQHEEIIKKAEQHALQQRRYRGQIMEGPPPDAHVFNKANPKGN